MVDYTSLFTCIGKYLKKLNNYFATIATLNTDQGEINTVLVAQSRTTLADGLDSMMTGFRSNIESWVNGIIGRIQGLLLDPTTVTNQFSFGLTPSVQTLLQAMILEMSLNDVNVKASAMTTGSITRTTVNAEAGFLVVGTKLDGVNPPMSGAIANIAYKGLTSQMYPTDETLTFTCIGDSENGFTRGAEQFNITGSGAGSGPYTTSGENVGSLGTITVADSNADQLVANSSFDSWNDDGTIVGWEVASGSYEQSSPSQALYTGYAFRTIQDDSDLNLIASLDSSVFVRNQSYMLAIWIRKANDVAGDQAFDVVVSDDSGNYFSSLGGLTTTSSTVWTLFTGQFVIPNQIDDNFRLAISGNLDSANDVVLIDQVVITPVQYIAGAAFALFGGKDKFLQGDKCVIRLQNDDAGKFQSFFRKGFKVQLPTDATPTISDSLVT